MILEFIDTILSNSYKPIYGITFLVSLFYYPRYKHTSLRYFPIILAYTFFNGVLAKIVFDYQGNNAMVYNIYNIIFFLFFYYVFWSHLKRSINKKTVLFCAVLFLLASVINPFYEDFFITSQLYAYILGAVLLIVCIIMYYIELLNTPKILSIRADLLFWISAGLLLFYVGYVPIKITRGFFARLSADTFVNLRRVHLLLILVMYGCFIIGFIWTRKKSQD